MLGLGKSFSWSLLCILALFLVMTPSVEASDDATSNPVVVILFMFFGLGMGIFIMQGLSALGDPIPYTCVIFAVGIIFSLCTKGNGGLLTESVNDWVNIDADLLLFAFLPPLIFGEAMSLNFYHVKGGFLQAVILAGPGVLIGAALVGVITKYMLPYNWSWNLALCFGAILSATDPVAVVSLLKSAGASPKLTILIVGESLLNDGTAMVLFTIFYESLNGRVYTASSITAFFAAAAFGSVFLGLACGVMIIRWLRTANRPLKEIDTTIQIAITITSAYLIFFVAQYVLKISGVLACCGAGIVLSWLAPPIILSHETMHHVWGMIEWVLNTLIFLLAGLIIGNRVIDKVAPLDWLYVMILYVVVMAGRLFTIGVLYPWISTIGHKCTKNEAIFMSWAGLRGALSMALALLVERNCPEHLHEETSRLFFYVGGIAALTMIINATTANKLLVYLELLDNDSAEKNLIMQQIKKRLKRRMDSVLTEMSTEFSFTPQDLDEVRDSCSLMADFNMDRLYRDSERASSSAPAYIPQAQPTVHSAATNSDNAHAITEFSHSNSISFPVKRTSAVTSALSIEGGHFRGAAKDNTTTRESLDSHSGRNIATNNPATSLFGHSPTPKSGDGGPLRRVISVEEPTHELEDTDLEESMERIKYERQNRRTRAQAVSVGNNSGSLQRTKSMSMKADEIVRLLSMSGRGMGGLLIPELLTYVRAVFLEIVRVRYWHDIERGKIPRLSHSAKFLLYSIEVGADKVVEDRGAQDWLLVNSEITEQPLSIRLLSFLDATLPGTYFTYYLGKLEARREKRAVYMLNSFIDAHEHAQRRVHEFIVVDDDDEERAQSPEEIKVIDESKQAVDAARKLLSDMNADTVAKIRAKQAAALVLTKQAELIKNMVSEGLLTPQHAEEFLMEISDDLQRMEKDRNKMYWEQGEKLAKKRQALRKAEEEAQPGRRSSLFSMFDWQNKSNSFSPYGEEDERAKEEVYMGPGTVTVSQPLLRSAENNV